MSDRIKISLLVISVILAVAIAFFQLSAPSRSAKEPGPVSRVVRTPAAVVSEGIGRLDIPSSAVVEALASREVPCHLFEGAGSAIGIAAVVLEQNADLARVAIIDEHGVRSVMELAHTPNRIEIGARENGNLVVGAGDLRLNSKVGRDANTPEPLSIAIGSDVVYKSEKVLDFGIASDGSSFFAIEPTAGETSRLVIRATDASAEFQYDLGTAFSSIGDELNRIVTYTPAGGSIMILPSNNASDEPRQFYSTNDGRVTRIVPPEGLSAVGSAFESEHAGYFAEPSGTDTFTILKVTYDDAPQPRSTIVWSRTIPLEHFYGNMSLSDDAQWLLVQAWTAHVLDTNSGRSVFTWPIAGNAEEERRRLSSVTGDAAEDQENIGSVSDIRIQDGRLFMTRKYGLQAFKDCHLTSDPSECFRKAEQNVREVIDVFDMSSISIDAQPQYRLETERNFGCLRETYSTGSLVLRDGKLTYERSNNIGAHARGE